MKFKMAATGPDHTYTLLTFPKVKMRIDESAHSTPGVLQAIRHDGLM